MDDLKLDPQQISLKKNKRRRSGFHCEENENIVTVS